MQLVPGQHVVKSCGAYEHHGIYIGAGQVIHFAGVRENKREASIRLGPVTDFLNESGTIDFVKYGQCFAPEVIIRRAHSRLGGSGYHLFEGNCEHFARWCMTGHHASQQVHRATATLTGASSGAGLTAASVVTVGGAGAVAGFSGPGIMSGLATLGGTAARGIAVVTALPAAAAVIATNVALKDDPHLSDVERDARRAGRTAAAVTGVGATGASLLAVSLAGVRGLSAVGISSGLAAIGGTMLRGLLVVAGVPAVAVFVVSAVVHHHHRRRRA